jgi:sulfhydrogenase subunit beta (sulfur reductase)
MLNDKTLTIGSSVSLPKAELDALLADLRADGFETVGPHVQDESVVYKNIDGLNDLPRGYLSEQKPGSYRLTQTRKNRYFDFIPAMHSWKQYLFPSRQLLFKAYKEGTWKVEPNNEPQPRYALIGVRSCELAAIQVQDRTFIREDFTDPIYRARREGLFILAVNCLRPNATCFCASMGTGPRHKAGFDLCMTELDDLFLVEVGSELGMRYLSQRKFEVPSAFVQTAAKEAIEIAAGSMGRSMDTSDLPELLTMNLEAERWAEVAKRCLSCANCTQVCPTCFCWDATETVDVKGTTSKRERVWDSCFNPFYSTVFGGHTRPNIRSRYRQWLTHKVATWKGQFNVLGCVGCGRCITWCPVGIDITEEVAAIRKEVKS